MNNYESTFTIALPWVQQLKTITLGEVVWYGLGLALIAASKMMITLVVV